MRSNCYIEAKLEYWLRKRRWRQSGKVEPDVPYLCKRPAFASDSLEHYFVGTYDPAINAIRLESFKPVKPKKRLQLWQLPLATFFRGHWSHGDWPDTQPSDLMPLEEPPSLWERFRAWW